MIIHADGDCVDRIFETVHGHDFVHDSGVLGQRKSLAAEVVIIIFERRRPVSCECPLHSASDRPPGAGRSTVAPRIVGAKHPKLSQSERNLNRTFAAFSRVSLQSEAAGRRITRQPESKGALPSWDTMQRARALHEPILPPSAGMGASTRGAMLADPPRSYGHTRRLRASAPHAKPLVPSLTRRKRKTLIAGLFRRAVEDISPGRRRSQ